MPSQTPNLDLYKVNGETDGNDTFNVDVVLNDNWDKIDAAVGKIQEDLGNVTVPDASLTQKGITQLSSAIDSTSEAMAATPKAVKAAYDRGSAGVTAAAAAQSRADSAYSEAAAAKQLGVERKSGVVAALNSIGVPASTSEDWPQLIAKMAGVIRATGNATAADLLAGKSASNASGPFNGSMPNRSAENNHMPGLESTVWAGDRFFIRPPHGYYDGSTWVTALVAGLTAANLRAGVNVAGLIGTLQEGVQYATGNIGAMAPMTPINVDCGFVPRIFAWSGLRDDFSVRGSTIKYLTADGIEHSDVGNSIFYIVTSLRQVMTIQNNDSSGRYIRNVIWQAWA